MRLAEISGGYQYKISGDDLYKNSINWPVIPLGTITIQETKAPSGYLISNEVFTIHFRMDGSNVRAFWDDGSRAGTVTQGNEAEDISILSKEHPIRGGLHFIKIDDEDTSSGLPMAGVPFVLTDAKTGEMHVLISDSEGRVNTETNPHSQNTNGNDSLVSRNAEGAWVCSDPSKLDPDAGIWFGSGSASDDVMALPTGTYTIEEVYAPGRNDNKNLSTPSNKGQNTGIVIEKNGENVTFDTGYWTNPTPEIGTMAKNAEVDSKNIAMTGSASVVDTVSYQKLTKGDSYKLYARLVDKANPDTVIAETEKVFTADDRTGTVDVTFTGIDTGNLEGKTLVAFEYLRWKGIQIAAHDNVSDAAQTLYVPAIHTTLADKAVEDEVGVKSKNDSLVDEVSYENLAPREIYLIKGQLIQKSTGKVLSESQTEQFTVSEGKRSGSKDVTFTFDSTNLAGETVVAYERLYIVKDDGSLYELNRHEDINDTKQSVYFPKIGTTASDGQTGDHVGTSGKTSKSVDTVSLANVVVGKEYSLSGVLMNKKTGKAVRQNGKGITAEASFTVNADGSVSMTGPVSNAKVTLSEDGKTASGSIDLTFTYDTSVLEGESIVVFETLKHKGVEVDTHSDLNDENQTVHYPHVETTAKDGVSEDTVGHVNKEAVIVDTVKLTNLIPGQKYTVSGKLYDEKSGSVFTVNGSEVTQKADITVTADGTITASNGEHTTVTSYDEAGNRVDGTVDLTFTFDSSAISGKTLVVFEDLIHNNVTVAVHEDIHDDGQSIHYPELHTTAVDTTTGDHVGSIWGALVNGIRRIFGAKDADGNGIKDDVQQNIADTVSLKNLVPGKSYVISGKLMDADTGKAVVIDGKEITSSTVITVTEKGISATGNCKAVFDNYDAVNHDVDGSVELIYSLDSSKIQGTETVVFERLYHKDGFDEKTETPAWDEEKDLVNKHEDLTDKGQSVSEVGIHTTAVDMATGNDQGIVPNGEATSVIDDTVNLTKLIPGMTYQITGRLVNLTDSDFENEKVVYVKSDGSSTENIEEAVTVASDEFIAESETETHHLELEIKGSLIQGKDVTVFEDISHNGVVITSHPAKGTESTWSKDDFRSQTVHYMTGKTNATDGIENLHSTIADGTRTIEDKVYFENLVVGKTYSVTGTLHDEETGEALTDEGAKKTVTFKAAEDLSEAEYVQEKMNPSDNEKASEETDPESKEEIEGKEAADDEAESSTNEPKTAPVTDLVVTDHFDGTKTVSGYVTISFEIDASELAGKTIVAFEDFYHEGRNIYTHSDLEDLPQTIKIPAIHTNAHTEDLDESALYNEDGSFKEITITDTVSYENLWTKELLTKLHEEGLKIKDGDVEIDSLVNPVYDIHETGEYTMTGKLMDKATGMALTDVEGNEYVSSVHFVTDAEDGTVDVTFTINPEKFVNEQGENLLDGKTLVVYEDLYQTPEEGVTDETTHVGIHHDIDDMEQDIRVPKGRTHAMDDGNGTLTQEALSELTEEDLEKMALNHDSEVTLTNHEAEASEDMRILDMVSYENLHADTEYTVTGTLEVITERDENGNPTKWEAAVDDEGNPITQTVTFTTPSDTDGQDSVSGYVPVLFTFKGTSLAGKTTVAFEKFTREDVDVMVHSDINDEEQTDYIPGIHTSASDSVTGNHNGVQSETSYIIDEVSYENLESGKTYTLNGQLMDQDSSEKVGDAVSGTFIAGKDGQFIMKDGTIVSTMDDVKKSLSDGTKIETKPEAETPKEEEKKAETPEITLASAEVGNGIAKGTYVVAANEWKDGSWGFVHVYDGDPDEDGKLVNAVSVKDSAVIELTDGEFISYFNVSLKKNSKVEAEEPADAESIEETYKKDMAEVDEADAPKSEETETKESGVITAVNIDEETADSANTESIPAGRVSGVVCIVIPVDSSKLEGKTMVAFEKLFAADEGGSLKEIAHHEDIEDEEQSVHYIKVRTTATDKSDGDKTLATSGTVTVNDKVKFENLIPGVPYKVTGKLMDKATGNVVTVNGTEVTAEETFTPTAADGYINMEFTFDVTTLATGDYVVFEKLFDAESGVEIAKHEDLTDTDQTVSVPERPSYSTGDSPVNPWIPIAAVAAAAVIIAAVVIRRRKSSDR